MLCDNFRARISVTHMLNLLKEGTKHLSGVDEAVLKNIEAVRELAKKTRTSLGPNGLLVIGIAH